MVVTAAMKFTKIIVFVIIILMLDAMSTKTGHIYFYAGGCFMVNRAQLHFFSKF